MKNSSKIKSKHGDRAFGFEIMVIRGNCESNNRKLSLIDSNKLKEVEHYINTITDNTPVFELGTTTKDIRETYLKIIYRTREQYDLESLKLV